MLLHCDALPRPLWVTSVKCAACLCAMHVARARAREGPGYHPGPALSSHVFGDKLTRIARPGDGTGVATPWLPRQTSTNTQQHALPRQRSTKPMRLRLSVPERLSRLCRSLLPLLNASHRLRQLGPKRARKLSPFFLVIWRRGCWTNRCMNRWGHREGKPAKYNLTVQSSCRQSS